MIYLASPYSHHATAVMRSRFQFVQSLTFELIKRDLKVFSPIAYSHQFAQLGAGATYETWKEFDVAMLERCDLLAVLCIDGWNESLGVGAEIGVAEMIGLPVKMIMDEPKIDATVRSGDASKYEIIVDRKITWPTIERIAEMLR